MLRTVLLPRNFSAAALTCRLLPSLSSRLIQHTARCQLHSSRFNTFATTVSSSPSSIVSSVASSSSASVAFASTSLPSHPPQQAATSNSSATKIPPLSQPKCAIQLWPSSPTSASASESISSAPQLIRHFLSLLPLESLLNHYHTGAIVCILPEHNDAAPQQTHEEMKSACDDLQRAFGFGPQQRFTHHSVKRLDQAVTTNSMDGVSNVKLIDLPLESRPTFLLLIEYNRISACQLKYSRRDDNALIETGIHSVDLDDAKKYKRKNEYGYSDASPLVRACFDDMRIEQVDQSSTTAAAATTSSSSPSSSPSSTSPHILDVTMGAAVDSFLLASFGAQVTMIEQDPILALLMMDGLRRSSSIVKEITSRMTLCFGNSIQHLNYMGSSSTNARPHAIYADPFYPEPPPHRPGIDGDAPLPLHLIPVQKTSLSKKSMELAHCLWVDSTKRDFDEIEEGQDQTEPSSSAYPFHPSPANLALYSLVSAAFLPSSSLSSSDALSVSPRVILKQPSSPYARELLTNQMPFEVSKAFSSRDTVFYLMRKKVVKVKQPLVANKKGVTKKQKKGKRGYHTSAYQMALKRNDNGTTAATATAATSPFPSFTTSPPTAFTFTPIGHIRTVFHDKFSIPRQSSLSPSATGVLTLDPKYELKSGSWRKSVQGLEEFSHLWLVFVFNKHVDIERKELGFEKEEEKSGDEEASPVDNNSSSLDHSPTPTISHWQETVRPPRLGGARRVGVFASRSPYRPSPIGMSAVKLDRVEVGNDGRVHLHLSGVDLLDCTPILDIKPYIPYCDSIGDAAAADVKVGWAKEPVKRYSVSWNKDVLTTVASFQKQLDRERAHDPTLPPISLHNLITELLSLDPRHGYEQHAYPPANPAHLGRKYGFQVSKWNVLYSLDTTGFRVDGMQTMEEFKQERKEIKASGHEVK